MLGVDGANGPSLWLKSYMAWSNRWPGPEHVVQLKKVLEYRDDGGKHLGIFVRTCDPSKWYWSRMPVQKDTHLPVLDPLDGLINIVEAC